MKKALLYSLFVLVFISGCGANSAPIAVTLSTGATQALDQGQSVAITATVANDSAAKGVTWSLASGGQGAIANQTTTAVTYNAGSASGTAVITATSVTDITKTFAVTITVTAAPAITTTTLPAGVEGTAYSQAIAKTGGAGTVTFSISAGALPAGLTLSGAGTISGTPTGPNVTASFTVKVTDSSTMTPMTATQALSIAISLPAPPSITTTTLAAGVEGTAYNQTVAATGFGTLTFTTSAGALPAGLALSGTGTISGTPTGPNVTANFTVMVTDSSNPTQTATQALSILINLPPPPSITTTTLAAGVEGTAYSQPVVATGGLGTLAFTISAGTLPAGLGISPAGVITGTPTGPNGTANFTVMVTDHSNPAQSATKPLSILINLPPAPSISPTTLPGGNVGTPYTHAIAVTGGLGPFTWSVSSGTLPAGLSFDATTATISGIPTTQQVNVAFTIQVTDSSNPQQSGSQPYTVTIGAPLPLSITTTSPLPQGNLNVVYSATISATGGIAPYTFSLDGTSSPLPASLGFSSGSNQGLISGTPTVVGTFTNIIVDVHDSQGTPATAQQTFTLTVLAPPSITLLSPASGPVGTPITITGTNFGTTQGSSTVTFNGVSAGTATNWSSTSITVPVPAGATTGNVVVTVLSVASSGSAFTVTPSCTNNCTLSGTVTVNGQGFAGLTVTITGPSPATTTTNATTLGNGSYSFSGLTAGQYSVTASPGYTYSPTTPLSLTINSNRIQNFTATSTLTSITITGTLTYGGSKTGRTYIRVFGNGCTGNCNLVAGTSISTALSLTNTSYTVRGLQPGTYTVAAEIDALNNGQPNASNPVGSSAPFTISSDFAVPNIALADPTPPTPVVPSGLTVAPGNTFALVMYDQHNSSLLEDSNGREIATSYKIYIGTDVNATNLTPVTFTAHGSHDNNYIFHNLTPGIYYFKMSTFVGVTESALSPVVSATLAAGTGPNTVSGTVTFPGTATGPLYVGVFNGTAIYGEMIPAASLSSPQAYTFSGVPSGNYQAFAIIDMNNNGLIDPSDITNVNSGQGGPPPLAVTGNTNNPIVLTSAVSTINVNTSHQQFNGGSDSYVLSLGISWGSLRPVAMTLISGPNVRVPWDMPVDSNNNNLQTNLNAVIPQVGDTYQFQVTLYDPVAQTTSTQTMPGSVTAVLNSFVTGMVMQTTTPGSVTIPLLTWVTPASTPSPYTYSVGLFATSGSIGVNWNDHGGNNSNGLPSGTTSVLFNADGSSSVSSLPTTTNYQWSVTVQDANGNTSQESAAYNIP
jgi:hypothetical protein